MGTRSVVNDDQADAVDRRYVVGSLHEREVIEAIDLHGRDAESMGGLGTSDEWIKTRYIASLGFYRHYLEVEIDPSGLAPGPHVGKIVAEPECTEECIPNCLDVLLTLDVRDEAGRPLGSGVYFVELRAGKATDTRRLVIGR